MFRCALAFRAAVLASSSITSSHKVHNSLTDSSTQLVAPATEAAGPSDSISCGTTLSLEQGLQCPSLELVNSGTSIADHINQLSTPPFVAVQWMQLFSSRGVRHEAVLYAAAWKAFKAVVPHHADPAHSRGQLDLVVSAVARAFRLTSQQQLVHDHQLLIAGVGKCVECAPAMRSKHVADAMVGMRDLGRLTLTVAESASYRSRLLSPGIVEDPLALGTSVLGDDALHQQAIDVQLLDELADALETQIVRIAKTFTPEELLECISTLSVIGVCRSESVKALGVAAQQMKMTLPQITELLTCTSQLHSRVLETLDHHDDADGSLRELCVPLFMAIGKRLEGINVVGLGRKHPLLVVELRKLCERSADLNEVVPSLWEKIRCIQVSQTQVRRAQQVGDRSISDSLSIASKRRPPRKNDKHAAELNNPDYRDRYIPAQFRGWKGKKQQQRHLLVSKVASRQRFGTLRIRKGYMKDVERKYTKTTYQ